MLAEAVIAVVPISSAKAKSITRAVVNLLFMVFLLCCYSRKFLLDLSAPVSGFAFLMSVAAKNLCVAGTG